MSVLIVK